MSPEYYNKNLIVEDGALDALYSHLPMGQRRDAFKKEYLSNNINITEDDLLHEFLNSLPEDLVNVVAHNGQTFDFKWMRTRLIKNNRMSKKWTRLLRKDSLLDLAGINPDLYLSDLSKVQFEDALNNYAMSVLQLGNTKLLDQGAYELKAGLNDFAKMLNEIQTTMPLADGEVKSILPDNKAFDYLRRILLDPRSVDFTSKVDEALTELRAITSEGRNTYGQFQDKYLVNAFKNITPDSIKAFNGFEDILNNNKDGDIKGAMIERARLVEKFGDDAEMYSIAARYTGMSPDEVFETYGRNINLPRLLAAGENHPSYLYKIVMDREVVQHFFKVGETVLEKDALRMSAFAKSIAKSYSNIKNPRLILSHQDEIRKIYLEMADKWTHEFNPDLNNPIEQFLIIRGVLKRQGYTVVNRHKPLVDELRAQAIQDLPNRMSDNLRALLVDPGIPLSCNYW